MLSVTLLVGIGNLRRLIVVRYLSSGSSDFTNVLNLAKGIELTASRLVSVWNFIQSCCAIAALIAPLLRGCSTSSIILFRSKAIFRELYFFIIGNVPPSVVPHPQN